MDPIKRKSIFAGLYGNTLEWFDFLLYANFTPLFAQLFFPSDEYFVSLLLTFGVFSVGFFIAPARRCITGTLCRSYWQTKNPHSLSVYYDIVHCMHRVDTRF